jgi:hypothetical protein
VEPATLERSRELGKEAAARIADGTSIADAAAWLATLDDIKVVEHDDEGLRFRLDGGRHVWVLPGAPVSDAATVSPSTAGRQQQGGSSLTVRPAAFATPRSPDGLVPGGDGGALPTVVGGGSPDKTAIVLAPYAWSGELGGAGDVSEILSGTRGYQGGVTYLQNANEHDVDVTPDTFRLLAEYDVVYVRSRGATICPEPQTCHSVVAAADFDDRDLHLTPEEDSVMDIIIWRDGTEAYGLTADFFRTHYPAHIQNAIIFFDVSDTRQELGKAIKGTRSEYHYWEGRPEPGAGRAIISAYVAALAASGRSPDYVYHDMIDSMTTGGATFKSAFSSPPLRIREIVSLLHPDTLEPLVDGQALEITGEAGDGQPDRVRIAVDVEGIDPGDEQHTALMLFVGDAPTLAYVVEDDLSKVGDHTWRLETEVEVGDLDVGQALEVSALAELAEGGSSQQELTVTVADEPSPDVGRVWTGTVIAEGSAGLVTKTAEITLTRDPDQDPDARSPRFMLTHGTLRWSAGGTTVNGCGYSAPVVDVDLPPDATYPVLTFYLPAEPGGPITYSATASLADGPSVDVTVDCPGGIGSVEYQERVGGSWWEVPKADLLQLTGDTITGTSHDGKYRWTLRRVE